MMIPIPFSEKSIVLGETGKNKIYCVVGWMNSKTGKGRAIISILPEK